ncbi:MAG: EamA family transporter RarD [Chloroflexi bacterium]|nr:EamA family transporter RarD [Chloroflexota bacterium]
MNNGIWYAIVAYGLWGVLPIYWKLLHGVAEPEVISFRVLSSLVLLAAVVALSTRRTALLAAMRQPRTVLTYLFTAILIAINWGAYIWAVNADLIVETSLGYYINPLLSVLFGVVVLRERMAAAQWAAIALAGAGVVVLTLVYGRPPWIALTLATTFALYGLAKKLAPLDPFVGLTLENGVLLIPAALIVGLAEYGGGGALGQGDPLTIGLLLGAGLVTTVPMFCFTLAAQRIPLSLIGVLQYLAPTLQFLIGVLVYREPFSHGQLIGFSLVWLALAVFGLERMLAYRATRAALPH